MKVGIIFGSASSEHEVSVVSASNIIKHLNKKKYDIYPIYIDKFNEWFEVLDANKKIENYKFGELPNEIKMINNVFKYLKNMDVVIPIIHGKYGEDGSVIGLLKMLDIPFIGCDILASSICMDKVYTKILLQNTDILVTPSIYIRHEGNDFWHIDEKFNEEIVTVGQIDKLIKEEFNYPVFVKPANSGSSIGINKAKNIDELNVALYEAKAINKKILIEKEIKGQELECAIYDNNASVVGEIKFNGNFYSYDSKYKDSKSITLINANISKEEQELIKNIALKAFKVVDCKGLARVDFFKEQTTSKIYLNEINTMPGFTDISMYPKLVEASGMDFSVLLDNLIEKVKITND